MELELPDGSYYISDIQDYFEQYIFLKNGGMTVNSSIRISNRISFRTFNS